jgi:multicomponent Na+:H+ antiporter subunit E
MRYYNLDEIPDLEPLAAVEVQRPTPSPRRRRAAEFLVCFTLLFFTWVLLSGRLDAFHLILGAISSALVSFLSWDLLFKGVDLYKAARTAWRFPPYALWLLWQITLASIHVLRLALSPRMMEQLDPHILTLDTPLRSDMALTTLGNSITLTPGTITVYVHIDGVLSIHAIDRRVGDEASLREMAGRVRRVFMED